MIVSSSTESESSVTLDHIKEEDGVIMHHPFGVKNNTFYIYLCIFENLHIILPFTDFKCEILRVQNVAPS